MLRVRVLGELALELDEVPVDPPQSRRARSVLGLLALDRRSHSRSQLAATLWPDVLDESARTSLRSALSALRRSLGPDADRYLVATRERVGLADDVWSDAAAFDQLAGDGRLQEALDLYRGDVLWGLDDDWVLTARDSWRERVARVHDRLAAEAEAAGDEAAALAHTRRMVALDPLAEESQRALIRRLARTGERAAAIAVYTRYAERLRTELRIVPSAETRALVDGLRSTGAEPEESVEAPALAAALKRRIPLPAELTRHDTRLVDREAELRFLADAWSRTRAGPLGVVLVAGEPGIGKTRLVGEFCQRAHTGGATVLLGCSYEEGLLPYQPFAEVLRQCLSVAPAAELRLQLGPRRPVLAKLVPELGAAGDATSTRGGDASGEGERYALFDAVNSLLCEAARARPAILVLDDLHWADDASLLLLRHLARSAADAPVLVLGTYRETEVHGDDPLSSALDELRRGPAFRSLSLRGLGDEAVAALIRDRGTDLADDVAHAVAERTEGNPFFVEEIVRHLDASGGELSVPESVKHLLRRRLRRLREPARRALSAAAVLGREFHVDALERVTGSDVDELLEAMEEALSARVLVELPTAVGHFAFAHALIRETVYEDLSVARRARLHLRAGEALEQVHSDRLDQHAGRLAHHFMEGGDYARSLDYHVRAARAAWQVYAAEAALTHYGAALEAATRLGSSPEHDERLGRVLLERGWVREVTGDLEAGVADYGRALAAARVAGDRPLEAEALDSLAFAEKQFDLERSQAHHHEALDIAGQLDDARLQVRILSHLALTRANHLNLKGALDAGERALELAVAEGDDHGRVLAIDALKLAALQLGELDRLAELTAELEAIERRQRDLWYLQWTLLESSFVPLARARWEPAMARLEEALAINRRIGDAFCGPLIHDAACWLERSRGELGRALVEGHLAVELTERAARSPWGSWTRSTLGWTLLDLRAAAEAVAVLESALAEARTPADRFRAAGHLAWAYSLAGDAGRAAEAAREAEHAFATLEVPSGRAYTFGFGAVAALARAHLAAGRPERGEPALAPLLEVATRSGWHEAAASASLVLALCHEARSDAEGAEALLRGAVELAEQHDLPGVEWESRATLARLSACDDSTRLRSESAAIVERLAAGVDDERLAAGFVHAAEG